jgi:hypothetical protein
LITDKNEEKYQVGRGILENTLRGCVGMHLLSHDVIYNSDFYLGISADEIEQWFNVSRSTDVRAMGEDIPVYQSVDSVEKSYIENLVRVLNDAGRVLRSFGCHDFFEFLEIGKNIEENVINLSASSLVTRLSKHFYGFGDSYKIHNASGEGGEKDIWFCSKSKKLVMDLVEMFKTLKIEKSSYALSWHDLDQITIAVDYDVVRALLHIEAIQPLNFDQSQLRILESNSGIEQRKQRNLSPELEFDLRCVAQHFCDTLLAEYRKEFNTEDYFTCLMTLQREFWNISSISKSQIKGLYNPNSVFF